MRPPLPRAAAAAAVLALLAVPVAADAAGSIPSTGRYHGTTGDGHLIEFTVERSAKSGFARKITHFHVVYDIAGCRSGPVFQPFFASVRTSGPNLGRFARNVGASTAANTVQLRLTGRFTSPSRASGSFRVGVAGKCPIGAATKSLTFSARRR